MTSYIAISSGEIDADSPVTADLMSKLSNNPLALAELSTGAPVNQAAWHPYDSTVNGTGTGLIYSFAVTGTVSSVESPTFADGYEYAFLFDGISSTVAPANWQVEMYRATSGSYSGTGGILSTVTPSGNGVSGWVELRLPRRSLNSHVIGGQVAQHAVGSNNTGSNSSTAVVVFTTTAQKIDKVRFSWDTGGIDAGNIYMYRRRID